MPNLGDIVRGTDIGLRTSHKHQWSACCDCGRAKWILLKNGKPQSPRCASCAAKVSAATAGRVRSGKDHHNWKGGRSTTELGYIEVWLHPDDPLYVMAGREGYVYEHRLVMARFLGRPLDRSEEVHHVNHNKHDNRIENLEVLDKRVHAFNHATVKHLLDRIAELEAENRQLKDSPRQK